jgi:hypothetical protein
MQKHEKVLGQNRDFFFSQRMSKSVFLEKKMRLRKKKHFLASGHFFCEKTKMETKKPLTENEKNEKNN